MVFCVRYPRGEQAVAIGYPGTTLVVNQVPPGPESCLYDELEVTHDGTSVCPVVRVLGGPRRPTHRVRLLGDQAVRDAWIVAREADGWETLEGHDADPAVVWVVATRDGLDIAQLDVTPGTREPR